MEGKREGRNGLLEEGWEKDREQREGKGGVGQKKGGLEEREGRSDGGKMERCERMNSGEGGREGSGRGGE